ncbi:threonine--tRNA ligase [Patescibacteria group bacterium]|nr:threonine--tRNA ligase [Patescibacteria group bacterium]MBU4000369.1 threonine--tRNA ligase [Patescibacteria group bacterium]MBU4056452.1 threonine--tRNA ligase [Patescibacteria group bacterium]MBU4368840.1 threonine--tRNA ligase [Patescibacteria group bacterium]
MNKNQSVKKDNFNIEISRHSLSHILATAVLEMFPEAKFGVGPAIENGFYYDFGLPRTLIPEDLPILEEKMRKIIKQNLSLEKREITHKEAVEHFNKAKQKYKVEILATEAKEKFVSVYKTGAFVDLCRGPHIDSAGEIDSQSFKLTKIAGAYWRGDEKNKMLQRIYGVAFNTPKELNDYLRQQEEAEKRDHRKLGKELDLFTFSDLVGSGLPLYTPKGVVIIDELKKHIEKICAKYGFKKVMTPHLAKIDLFKLSGHAGKFNKELFHVSSSQGHDFVMKPVQCPHQAQIYASKQRSYRDLPIRYMESEKQYRAEKSGEVGGLNRVYAITVEDGHSFCRVEQVKEEIINMVNIIKNFYSVIGLWGNHWVSLSVRDYKHPEKYIGDPKDWDKCEKMLEEISKEMELDAKKIEGEAAVYGPKLDFMFKDAVGKEIQIPTVQLDFAMPKRFNLVYTNERGKEEFVVMVHRAILGSYERFLALMIEHFAGAFPLWLSPVQAKILPISTEKHLEYAKKIYEEFLASDIRAELDESNETLGKKIRAGELQKIPYLLIVGDKEMKENTVRVRQRGKGDIGEMNLTKFLERIKMEIENKKSK